MLFSSITFLYYFLPAVVLVYFLVPKVLKNVVLILASLLFYAWGEPRYVILMTIIVLVGYVAGIIMEKYREKILGKIAYISALFICLATLGFFKYADFFIESFGKVTGISIKVLGIALPIGISFYIFQLISYLIDVKRASVKAQKNIIYMFAYVTMFPQLIAGPIVRYKDIESQLGDRRYSFRQVREGITRFAIGLSKKMLIANQLAALCDIIRISSSKSVLFMWVYAFATALYIYYDFSGYSDMAIGLGKILGFKFPENFNYPFISKSITEFWRRWHMTLGSWFRDYVYIPMGGSRVSKVRLVLNILVVWMLTGLWHGAAWNFVLWGLIFAILLAIEKLWLGRLLENTIIIKRIYVILALVLSFVIFAANSIPEAFSYIKSMFGLGGLPFSTSETMYYLRSYVSIFLMALMGATPVIRDLALRLKGKMSEKCLAFIEPLFVILIIALSSAYIVDGSFNPFLYFRF